MLLSLVKYAKQRCSQIRFLLPLFSMFRRILHALVNVQNPSLFNPLRSEAPHCQSGRTLLHTKKKHIPLI